ASAATSVCASTTSWLAHHCCPNAKQAGSTKARESWRGRLIIRRLSSNWHLDGRMGKSAALRGVRTLAYPARYVSRPALRAPCGVKPRRLGDRIDGHAPYGHISAHAPINL